MASELVPLLNRATNNNGAPISGARLFFYATGTLTPASVFSDAERTTPHTNPVVADSAGLFAAIYLNPAITYRAIMQDPAGATIWDIDPVNSSLLSALAASGGAALVGYTQGGAGTSTRTVQDRLRDMVSVKDFGAVGDGSTDDTAAIQAAINAVSNGATLFFPSGSYRYTSTLTIPSNVHIRGSGRHFGSALRPDGCAAFNIDGNLYDGGWAFRIRIENILIEANNMTGPKGINVTKAYNVDFHNVFLFNVQQGVTQHVYFSGCNDIVLSDFILYGTNSADHFGIDIDGATFGPVSIKIYSPDLETCNRAIRATGEVCMDIVSPYAERNTVCYTHQITSGQVNIFGGTMKSANGHVINLAGPNLLVDGTDLDPYTGVSRGGPGINATGTTAYPNVSFRNIPRVAQSEFIPTTTNLLSVNLDRPPISNFYARTFWNRKVLTDNAAQDLFQLRNFAEGCKCRLTLHGVLGVAYVIKEFEWIIVSPGSTFSSVATRTVLDTSGGNWIANLTMTLTADAGNAFTTISATADTSGALGEGQPFTVTAQLDIVAIESGVGGVYAY